jgi:bifunctional UDP-N-acetylglucosamine pyrophosphorylase/glucosamine-1-phosphate N-acetyltransferase
MSLCAVIPAAGRGTRLGVSEPKIFTPLGDNRTAWSVLQQKLSPLVDHIHLVLSPDGAHAALPAGVSHSIQAEPTGMGDAIFQGYQTWSQYDSILIVWGDQVFVSADTFIRTITALGPGREVVMPVTRQPAPYVEHVFAGGHLTKVLQSREGDATRPNGFNDVGTFALNTAGLKTAWDSYRAQAARGAATAEVNFLPFLPFLDAQGWRITPLEVTDATESRGINTPEDLEFFRTLFT